MNNPLFSIYAAVVERFFVQKRVGDRIAIFPGTDPHGPSTAEQEVSQSVGRYLPRHLTELINQNDLKATQEVVDHFRGVLSQERGQAKFLGATATSGVQGATIGGQTQTPANLAEKFSQFQAAIKTGEETGLQSNPFYELTKLVFHHNMVAAKNLFMATHLELVANPPEPVRLLRRFREIWFEEPHLARTEKTGVLRKISDQVDSWMGLGKVIVAVVLFFGSSFTTGRGVNDLLQSAEMSQWAGGVFDGREAEFLRYSLSLMIAVLLSSTILDYKDRLFRAIAEEGRVLRGIRRAFLINPCWMILATLLTIVSVKTNYDGIVSIISKKADLAKQSEKIRSQVKRAIGNPFFINTVDPNDLHDLQGLLQQAIADSVAKFQRVPDDEVSGVASSGDPRKGPRYWGKYFIVNGGYAPGIQDVVRVYQNVGLSAGIDDMLRSSGLDLRTSIADKLTALGKRYDDHLRQTETQVTMLLDTLNGLMEMRGYSLEEIKRVFALEHYQINDIVLEIATAMETNKVEYERVAVDLNKLTDSYVAVLQQVDKSGAATRKEYHIEGKLVVPEMDAIKELKNTKIPKATHKSFAELKEFLISEYGLALANGLLFAILFLSVCMDLLDPLIYSRWTAMIGQQDKRMFLDLMEYLREWENDFVIGCYQFFYRRDVLQVFKGVSNPNRTGIRNAFYLLLERIDPLLRDPRDQPFLVRYADWFAGLFRLVRTDDMRGYNQRAQAIRTLVTKKELYFVQFLEYLFPGIRLDRRLGSDPFLLVAKRTEIGQAYHREIFAWELQVVLGKSVEQTLHSLPKGGSWDEQKELSKTLLTLNDKRKSLNKHKESFYSSQSSIVDTKSDMVDPSPPVTVAPGLAGPVPGMAIPVVLLKARLRPEPRMSPLLRIVFKENSPAYHYCRRLWHCSLLPPVAPFPHTRRRWLQEIVKQDGYSVEHIDGLCDFMPDLKRTLLEILPGIQRDFLGPLEEIRGRFPDRCAQAAIPSKEVLGSQLGEIEKESLQILGLSPAMGDQTRLYASVGGIDLDSEGVSRDVLNHIGGDTAGFNSKIEGLAHLSQESLVRARAIETATVQDMTSILKEVKRFHDSIQHIHLKINLGGSDSKRTKLPTRGLLRLLHQNKDLLEQAPKRSEAILRTMEQIFGDRDPYTETSFEVLKRLYAESRQVFEELREILVLIQGTGLLPTLERGRQDGEQDRDVLEPASVDGTPTAQELSPAGGGEEGDEHAVAPLTDDDLTDLDTAPSLATIAPVGPDRVADPASFGEIAGKAWFFDDEPALEVAKPDDTAAEFPTSPTDEGASLLADEAVSTYQVDHTADQLQPVEIGQPRPVAVSLGQRAEPLSAGQANFASFVMEEDAGDGQLIPVAAFAWHPPDPADVVQSQTKWADRLQQLAKLPWGASLAALDDGLFFSGMVSADPDAEWRAVSAVAQPPMTIPTSIPPPPEQAVVVPQQQALQPYTGESATPVRSPPVSPAKPRRRIYASGAAAQQLPTALEFETKTGLRFRGVTRELSLNGLEFGANADLAQLRVREQGSLQLVSASGTHQFPCEVVQVSASDITLKLFAKNHTFAARTKAHLFAELQQDHHALKQARQALFTNDSPVADLEGGQEQRNNAS